MKSLNRFVVVIFCAVYLANSLYAHTCVRDLKAYGKTLAVRAGLWSLAIPVFGLGAILMGDTVAQKLRLNRNVSILKAATIVTDGHSKPKKDVAAHIIDKFYDELTEKYPEMKMGKAQVAVRLKEVNFFKFGEAPCSYLRHYSLINFFPEGAMNHWIEEKDRIDRERKAREARDEKNHDLPWDHDVEESEDSLVEVD